MPTPSPTTAWALALAALQVADVAFHLTLLSLSGVGPWGFSGLGDLAALAIVRALVTGALAALSSYTTTSTSSSSSSSSSNASAKRKVRAAYAWRASLLLVSAKALTVALESPDDVKPNRKHHTAGLYLLGVAISGSFFFTAASAAAFTALRRSLERKREDEEQRKKRIQEAAASSSSTSSSAAAAAAAAASNEGDSEAGMEEPLLGGGRDAKEEEQGPAANPTSTSSPSSPSPPTQTQTPPPVPTSATIRTLASLAAEDAPLLCLAFFAGCTAALGNAQIPFLTGRALDDAALRRDEAAFHSTLLDLAGAAMLTAAATAVRGGLFFALGVRLNLRTRSRLFASILSCEPAFFDANKVGDLTSRLSADTSVVSDQLSLNLNVLARSVTQAVVVLAFMLQASWRLTALTAAGLPFVVSVSRVYGAFYREASKTSQAELAGANAVADEALGGLATLRAHAALGGALYSYEKKLAAFRAIQMSESRMYSLYQLFSVALPNGVACLVLLVGGRAVLAGQMSGGSLISFLLYQGTLSSTVQALGDVWSALAAAVGAADKVVELLLRKPKLPAPGMPETYKGTTAGNNNDNNSNDDASFPPLYRPPPGSDIAGAISFRNVSFSYPTRPNTLVLNGFELEIAPGECVALVGASGGGKSSVVKLLLRLYDPQSGSVCVDGRPVGSFDPAFLARRIGIVSQDAQLFGASVSENIALGLTEADGFEEEEEEEEEKEEEEGEREGFNGDGDVERGSGGGGALNSSCLSHHRLRRRRPTPSDISAAARLARCSEFIEALPQAYDTVVGERGSTLSGGQRQRVCIARSLVRDPAILILDEATSALDAASEAEVVDALRDATRGRTTLVVAHRLSTVRDAHRVGKKVVGEEKKRRRGEERSEERRRRRRKNRKKTHPKKNEKKTSKLSLSQSSSPRASSPSPAPTTSWSPPEEPSRRSCAGSCRAEAEAATTGAPTAWGRCGAARAGLIWEALRNEKMKK